jgi:hypothetical protein
VAIGAQRLAINQRLRDGVDDLLASTAHQPGTYCRRRHFDQHHVVKPDAIEAVLQRQYALDLVGLDHRFEHLVHLQGRLPAGKAGPRQPVGSGKNAAEVVGGMAPLGRQPGVVEIKPANQGADVEGGLHRVELKLGAGNSRPMGYDGAGDNRPQQFAAGRIGERFESTAEGVDQTIARRLEGFPRLDLEVQDVVGNVDQDLVGIRAGGGNSRTHKASLRARRCRHRYSEKHRRQVVGYSASSRQRDKLLRIRPDVVGRRTNQLAIDALLDDMC